MFGISMKSPKKLKYHIYHNYNFHFKKTLCLSIVYSKCGLEHEKKYLKKKNQLKN